MAHIENIKINENISETDKEIILSNFNTNYPFNKPFTNLISEITIWVSKYSNRKRELSLGLPNEVIFKSLQAAIQTVQNLSNKKTVYNMFSYRDIYFISEKSVETYTDITDECVFLGSFSKTGEFIKYDSKEYDLINVITNGKTKEEKILAISKWFLSNFSLADFFKSDVLIMEFTKALLKSENKYVDVIFKETLSKYIFELLIRKLNSDDSHETSNNVFPGFNLIDKINSMFDANIPNNKDYSHKIFENIFGTAWDNLLYGFINSTKIGHEILNSKQQTVFHSMPFKTLIGYLPTLENHYQDKSYKLNCLDPETEELVPVNVVTKQYFIKNYFDLNFKSSNALAPYYMFGTLDDESGFKWYEIATQFDVKYSSGKTVLSNQPKTGDKYYALKVSKNDSIKYFNWGSKTLSIKNLGTKPVWYVKEIVDIAYNDAKEFFESLGFTVELVEKTF